jgi:uncharacterized membrane protein
MRTLKISLVATIAALVAWQLRIPHRIWPAHPGLADFLLALIITLVVQFTWSNEKGRS